MKKKIDNVKRIKGILVTICLFFVSLTGCGSSNEITTNTLSIGKGGSITQTIVEDFSADTYDIEEFNQMNQQEIEEYNTQAGAENISVEKSQTDGNTITVVIKYQSANDYYGFNHEALYVGTIDQAKTAGYDMSIPLKSVKDESVLTKEEIEENGDRYVAIVTEPVDVRTFGTILYISDGVTYVDKKLVTVSGESAAYIVFK